MALFMFPAGRKCPLVSDVPFTKNYPPSVMLGLTPKSFEVYGRICINGRGLLLGSYCSEFWKLNALNSNPLRFKGVGILKRFEQTTLWVKSPWFPYWHCTYLDSSAGYSPVVFAFLKTGFPGSNANRKIRSDLSLFSYLIQTP